MRYSPDMCTKDKEIAVLKVENERLITQIQGCAQDMTRCKASIFLLESRLGKANNKISQLEAQLENLDCTIESQAASIKCLCAEIIAIDACVAAKNVALKMVLDDPDMCASYDHDAENLMKARAPQEKALTAKWRDFLLKPEKA